MELQALATRKITAYHTYRELHQQLSGCTSLQQCAQVSGQLLDAYQDNRMIWQELEYYQKHHVILGKHPIFSEFRSRRALNKMSVKELMIRKRQVEGNIWRVKSEMAKGNKPHLDAIRQARLKGYQSELNDINRLLEYV